MAGEEAGFFGLLEGLQFVAVDGGHGLRRETIDGMRVMGQGAKRAEG
jgi:hypothetical protein